MHHSVLSLLKRFITAVQQDSISATCWWLKGPKPLGSNHNMIMTQCSRMLQENRHCGTQHTQTKASQHTLLLCATPPKPPPLPFLGPHTPNPQHTPAVTDAGQYNDLATPFMSMPGDTIRHIFSVEGGTKGREDYTICDATSACHFTARSLGILSAFYLMLMALASGVAVPGGLFMPSIMVSQIF